jgi:hypothetical protein
MRNDTIEKHLFVSIEKHGIHTPLQGICRKQDFILLDGFKRYRTAKKLSIEQVPVDIVGNDLVPGFLSLLRRVNDSRLSVLEEASFLHDLHTDFNLSYREIAYRVERSIGWVSVRINLLRTMDDHSRKMILDGKFPLRSYMYTLAPFTRVNTAADIRNFINATGGKGYSTRDIEILSRGYFSEDTKVKEQILLGNTDWTLQMLKNATKSVPEATDADKICHALKSCHWYTGQVLKHYRRSPDLFAAHRTAFECVINNCKNISKLVVKE